MMAIEKGNSAAMHNLAIYYSEINDTNNMLKYYLMAIKNGNNDAKNNLLLLLKNHNIIIETIQLIVSFTEKNLLIG